jgi:hypothetical protein
LIKGEVLILVLNEREPRRLNGALARACAHCTKTGQALVLDVSAMSDINMAVFRTGLLEIEAAKPPALCVVVAPELLDELRAISLEAAHRGWGLGAFARRDVAVTHALRERRLASVEPFVPFSSASIPERAKSTTQ